MKKLNGFTLVELMVTLSVAAIVLSIGIPSFRDFVQNNRAATQANHLVLAFNTARSESVKRGSRVSVCASTDQSTCSAGTNWETGWILFTDDSGANGSRDAADTIIRVWDSLSGSTTLSSADSFIQYLGNGQINHAGNATFTLTLPDCTGDNVRNISISPTGRVSSLPPTACP